MPLRHLLLLVVLLLVALSGRAQSRRESEVPAGEAPYQEVKVRVTLPKAIGIVRDYSKILLSRNDDKDRLQRLTNRFRGKTAKPVVEVTVEVPRNWVTKKLGLAE